MLTEVPLNNVDTLVSSKTVKAQKSFNLKIYDMSSTTLPVINLSVIKEQIIDISSLSKGTYIVHIDDNYVKKFKL